MSAIATEPKLAGGFTRRGACPALSAPMQTGDGLLVRLNPVEGGLSPEALTGLCDAAETHGNGVVEITAKGSIQARGLTRTSAAAFAQDVDLIGISVRTGVPVQTGILAGLDPREIRDPTGLAQLIRSAISATGLETKLGPKISVVVDGGGQTALGEVAADVRLTAAGGEFWQVAIAGDAYSAEPLGVVQDDRMAADTAIMLLSEIADGGRASRARDVELERFYFLFNDLRGNLPVSPPSGLPAISPSRGEINRSEAECALATREVERNSDESLISPLEGEMAGRPEGGGAGRNTSDSFIGTTPLRDSRHALGVALPFGHTTANHLKTFAKAAARLGVTDLRPAPRRTLVALCPETNAATQLQQLAQTLGFITAPDDPRLAVSACAGAPDCASGHIPARRFAAEIAMEYKDLLDGHMHLHVSGCAKGCAHPASADLVLVGSMAGIGLVADGTARDEPIAYVGEDAARQGLARLSATRQTGETTAQAIKRIGLSALAETFGQGRK